MAAPQREQVLDAHQKFVRALLISVGVIVLAHVLPKSTAPRNGFRLLLTLAYFAAWLTLCYQMIVVRPGYMRMLFAWLYDDCPPSFARIYRRFLAALDQVVRVVVGLFAAFVASTFLSVLHLWFHGFGRIEGLYDFVWWMSLIGLVGVVLFGNYLFTECGQTYRMMKQELAQGGFNPRTLADLKRGVADDARRPGETLGDRQFYAGGEEWHWESLYKNCVVFGQTGTGKTVCVLNAMVEGLVASTADTAYPCGGLILDPKGDFKGKLESLLRRHGRAKDLLIIDPARPQSSIRWNPFDSDDDELELASRFTAVLEALGMKDQGNSFWMDSARKLIRHSIALIRLTNPPGEPPTFADIGRLASSFEAVAERTDRLDPFDDRCEACLNFFADEWVGLAGETRTSIQAYVTNMIDPFLMEPYRSMFAGRSTVRMDRVLADGHVLYVNMPIADKEAMARTVGTFVKLAYFREVLKNPDKPRPSFFLCDEFQVFFTTAQGKGDADFFERSRQSNHANLIATQNLPALMKVSPQDKNPVNNLLGNCATKIFLRNNETETNEWASKLFGQQLVTMGSVSASGGGGGGGGGFGGRFKIGGQGFSGSDQYDSVVRPERFSELAVPDRAAADMDHAEAIIHRGATARADGVRVKTRWPVHVISAG